MGIMAEAISCMEPATPMLLGRTLVSNCAQDRTALPRFSALMLGSCGQASLTAFAFGESIELALAAIKIGTICLLLPVFFTGTFRMGS